jgi:molybdopterin molybdotransferase
MGDFDFVPRAVEELGGRVHFDMVAVKPGKPTLFATLGEKLIFGLPGNPVSTFIITEILVKPALNRLMNCVEPPLETVGRLTAQVSRRKTERTEFRPVHCCGDRWNRWNITGSAHLLALPRANGLIRIERGVARLDAGSEVRVRLL